MEYLAGLDVSMEQTHIYILDRDGVLIREGKAASTPKGISEFLVSGPLCAKVVFETGRMAPMLYHGLAELGVPVVLHREQTSISGPQILSGTKD